MNTQNLYGDRDRDWILPEHRLGAALIERAILDLQPQDIRSILVTVDDVRDAVKWVLDLDDDDGTFLWWASHLRLGKRVTQHIRQLALDRKL